MHGGNLKLMSEVSTCTESRKRTLKLLSCGKFSGRSDDCQSKRVKNLIRRGTEIYILSPLTVLTPIFVQN